MLNTCFCLLGAHLLSLQQADSETRPFPSEVALESPTFLSHLTSSPVTDILSGVTHDKVVGMYKKCGLD
jgi:hypothetical protein